MEEVKKKQLVSLAEVKEILEKVDTESLDQIQRWTYDYVSKFTKTDPKIAKKMKQDLIKECKKRGITIVDDNGKFSALDKNGKSHKLNNRDMKKYKSGKKEVPNYFIEFLDVL